MCSVHSLFRCSSDGRVLAWSCFRCACKRSSVRVRPAEYKYLWSSSPIGRTPGSPGGRRFESCLLRQTYSWAHGRVAEGAAHQMQYIATDRISWYRGFESCWAHHVSSQSSIELFYIFWRDITSYPRSVASSIWYEPIFVRWSSET